MANRSLKEISISAVLIALLVGILNPFHLWMPDMLHMMMLAGALVVFGLFAAFILREKITDERDGVHRMFAGRVAYLVGTASLLLGIVYQSYADNLDNWLVVTLVIMVLAKVMTHLYSDKNY